MNTPESSNNFSQGELTEYPDGRVDEVFKQPGLRFDMQSLADRIDLNPEAHDFGCVYIQTVEKKANGASEQRRYYFDSETMFDPQSNRGTHLDQVDLTSSGLDITIGQRWVSPMGTTRGKVEAVALPWTSGYDPSSTTKGRVSPMSAGRRALDWVAEQPHATA